MSTIGIVCEGPRDYEMITKIVSHFSAIDFQFQWLQPNQEFGTDLGSGWRGVYRWCEKYGGILDSYLNDITPKIDMLIIHMDADVIRCEKEVFCPFVSILCEGQGHQDYLNCEIAKKNKCPQKLPPNTVCDGSPRDRVSFAQKSIMFSLNIRDLDSTVIVIPCDSMEAWILAAYEQERDDIEKIDSPWDIISRTKSFHGIRIKKDKKSKKAFEPLINQVCLCWDSVKQKCPQAQSFQDCFESHFKE